MWTDSGKRKDSLTYLCVVLEADWEIKEIQNGLSMSVKKIGFLSI